MFFNRKEPLNNKLVRQAIAYAVNRSTLSNVLHGGYTIPSRSPFPATNVFFNDKLQGYAFDVDKANSLLDEAGYARKSDGMRFELNLIFIAQLLPKINFLILSHGQWYEHTKTGKSLENTTMLYDLAKTKVKKLSNFYIFLPGKKDVELFNKVGVNKYNDKIKIEAIGSYEASYYNSLHSLKSKNIKQDLLFVSQLYDNFFNLEDELSKLYIQETAEALKLLSRYASENNLSLSFLCRNKPENDKREINYVKSIIKDASKIKILKNIAKPLWKEIFASSIITTIDSTVGFDTISVKKKTLLMPLGFTNTKTFTVDENSLLNNIWKWTIINNDYENFRLSLNELIKISELKYEKSIQKEVNYWFNDQNQLPAFQYVQKFIRNKLI